MAPGIKFPLSARIVAAQRYLDHILDSFWAWAVSLFSKQNTPALTDESKPEHRTPNTELQSPTPKNESKFVRSHRRLLEVLGGFATILTLAGFYLSYLAPKLSVDATGSLQSSSPMGTLFYLSNDGALPIHEVVVTCGNIHIDGEGFKVLGFGLEYNAPPQARADILSPGHKMTLPYAPAFGFSAVSNLKGARLVIRAHYRPAYVPWHKTETFPFEAIRTTNGTWIWRSIAQ